MIKKLWQKLILYILHFQGEADISRHKIIKTKSNLIFTVITRLEVNKLTTELEKIAPNAFVVMHTVKDTKGGMIKKRPLKN